MWISFKKRNSKQKPEIGPLHPQGFGDFLSRVFIISQMLSPSGILKKLKRKCQISFLKFYKLKIEILIIYFVNSYHLNMKFSILQRQELDTEIPIDRIASKKKKTCISLSIIKPHLTLKTIEWKCQLMACTDLYF